MGGRRRAKRERRGSGRGQRRAPRKDTIRKQDFALRYQEKGSMKYRAARVSSPRPGVGGLFIFEIELPASGGEKSHALLIPRPSVKRKYFNRSPGAL